MLPFCLSILGAIAAMVMYHLVLKVTPSGVNPAISLIATYLTSALLCVALLPLFPLKNGVVTAFRQLNWASYALAVTLVGLEVGFLLAYRAGWKVSTSGIVVSAAVALLLIPIGLLIFKERLSPVNVVGILVCIGGLVLVNV